MGKTFPSESFLVGIEPTMNISKKADHCVVWMCSISEDLSLFFFPSNYIFPWCPVLVNTKMMSFWLTPNPKKLCSF